MVYVTRFRLNVFSKLELLTREYVIEFLRLQSLQKVKNDRTFNLDREETTIHIQA